MSAMLSSQMKRTYGLRFLSGLIHWLEGLISLLEELISVLSVPLLSFGVSASLVDFFMRGQLSQNPTFALSWSIIQAVSIDAQIAYTWHKAHVSWKHKKYWAFAGFLLIGIVIAAVVWVGSSLQGLEQSTGQDMLSSLKSLFINPTVLVAARAGVAVTLLCIAGWTRRVHSLEVSAQIYEKVEPTFNQNPPVKVEEVPTKFEQLLLSSPRQFTVTFDELLAGGYDELLADLGQTFVETIQEVLPDIEVIEEPTFEKSDMETPGEIEAVSQEIVQIDRPRKQYSMTLEEAAEHTGLSVKAIRDKLQKGILRPYGKDGNKVLVSSLSALRVSRSKQSA